jgi:hypothetical protein
MIRVITLIQWLIGLAAAAGFIYFMFFSESAKEIQERHEAQDRADRTPHVIREADGCKVYAFKTGEWHYFTRCPNSTVQTDRSYTENCGKNCTRHKVESITTQSE